MAFPAQESARQDKVNKIDFMRENIELIAGDTVREHSNQEGTDQNKSLWFAQN